jgi:hypothetical protein
MMIVQIPTACADKRARSQSDAGVTRDRPNNPAGGGADGAATQGSLFGIGHACAPAKRQADDQKNYY